MHATAAPLTAHRGNGAAPLRPLSELWEPRPLRAQLRSTATATRASRAAETRPQGSGADRSEGGGELSLTGASRGTTGGRARPKRPSPRAAADAIQRHRASAGGAACRAGRRRNAELPPTSLRGRGGREKEGGERSRWGDVTPGWGRGENCGMENFQPRASCACSATPRPLLPRLTASHPPPSSFLPPHPVRSSGRGALERSVLLTVVPPQPAQHLGQRGDALPGGHAPARQRAGVAGAPVGSKAMGPGGAVWRGEAPLEESLAAPSWAALPAVPRTGGEAPSRADTT